MEPDTCHRHGACLHDGGGALHTFCSQLLPCFRHSPSPLAVATVTAAATPDADNAPCSELMQQLLTRYAC
jgi:hypothetical protein